MTETIILTVVASDEGTPSLTAEVDVNIIVINVNDNPPVLISKTYHAKVSTDERAGKITIDHVTCTVF